MRRALGIFLLTVALSSPLWGFTRAGITVDGTFAEWSVVLSDADNTVTDGAKGAGDPDDPGQTSSDLRTFATTWDGTDLYFYFKRGTTSNSGITYLVYLDVNHNGIMESGELCLFWSFNNSGFQGFALYDYVSWDPSGDPLGGDGATLPGTVNTLLSTNGAGAPGPYGVRYEVSVPWTLLASYGVAVEGPMFLHPSLTLGINIPSQVEDNGNLIDTMIQLLVITPDNDASVKPGDTATFSHIVTNGGNASETAEVSAVSLQGWRVSFWDASGTTLLTDTNGNGTVDTGSITPGGSLGIVVKVTVPSSAPTQTNDTVTITVQAASNSSVSDTAVDSIYAGFVVTFKKDQEKWGMAGITVPYYGQVVDNLTDAAITIDVSSFSSQGWSREVWMDQNCDDTPESGPITQFSLDPSTSICLLTYVTIPSGTPIGTTDDTTTRITFGNPVITIDVESITHVEDRFTLTPDNTGSQGAGEAILYAHALRNNQAFDDLFNLTTSSSQGWSVTLLNEDGVTLLSDTDFDGNPDTGSLRPYGDLFSFKVRVTIPNGATFNTEEVTTVTATSTSDPLESRSATETTTVKVLVTFADAAYSTPRSTFASCAAVYFKAFGLSNGTYRFLVYEPSGGLKTADPAELTPDQSGQVSDSYQLLPGDPTGTWSVVLQVKSGSKWTDLPNYLAYFDVVNAGTLSVETGRAVYNQTGETLTVAATATNGSTTPFEDGSLLYTVFVDSNGNGLPDAGETYLDEGGTPGVYAPGDATHLTTPLSVPPSGEVSDIWSLGVADFGTLGTWTVYAGWFNACPSLIDDALTTFQVIYDAVPPFSAITSPADGATLSLSLSPFSITGTAGDNETYVAGVEVSTDGGTTWANAVNTGTDFSTWSYAWAPFYSGTYTLLSRATDAAGNVEIPTVTVVVIVVDDTPPTTPVVTDDGDYTAGTLHAVWSSEDANSGIDHYDYCIGTSPGACDVTVMTNVGLATEVTRNDIGLTNGVTYYFNVQATNLDGYPSAVGSSDGITADLAPPVSAVANPPAGTTVTGVTYTVTGTSSDALSGVASVELSTDGGGTYNAVTGTTAWSYSWVLPPDGNVCLKVRGRDLVGNVETPSCHWVTVDSYPYPPSSLSASETGFCQVALSWQPSASSDVVLYDVYSDQGSGVIDYTTPVASIVAPATSWTTPRGVYGYCPQEITLTQETTIYNQLHVTLINANKSSYTIDGMSVSWAEDPQGSEKRVERIYINGVLSYTAPVDPVSNNGHLLSVAPYTLTAGSTVPVQIDFKYLSGGDPDMQGEDIGLRVYGGGSSPLIDLPLALSGNYPSPCENDNRGSVEPGVAYSFGVRAEDAIGQEEQNTTVVVTITACNSSSIQAQVATPYAGLAVNGDQVTVYALLSKGTPDNLEDVTFQYRPVSGAWNVMIASNGNHPNPDTAPPLFIHWDVTGLAEGDYEIRAVARDKLLVSDINPFSLTLSIDHATPQLDEGVNGSGLHQADQALSPTMNNPITVGDDVDDNLTFALLYAGSFTTPTTLHLTIEDPLVQAPLVPGGWSHAEEFRSVTIDSGETLSSPMDLTVPVNDLNGDNVVDGTTVNLWDLLLYRYNGSGWDPLPTAVDLVTKEVHGDSTAFGLFAPLVAPYDAGDTVLPRAVTNLKAVKNGGTVHFTWDPVTLDTGGGHEIIHHYDLYRGTSPAFTPDQLSHTNLIGVSSSPSFDDVNSLKSSTNYYYLVTAVDAGGNEGAYNP